MGGILARKYLLAVLFHYPFLQVLRQIHLPDIRCSIICGDFCHIMTNHQLDELLEGSGLRIPAEFGLGFGRVAPEVDDISRAVEVFGNGNYGAADKVSVGRTGNGDYNTLLIDAFAFPAELDAGVMESQGSKLANSVLNTGCNYEIVRSLVLEYESHTLYIILGITPVTQ